MNRQKLPMRRMIRAITCKGGIRIKPYLIAAVILLVVAVLAACVRRPTTPPTHSHTFIKAVLAACVRRPTVRTPEEPVTLDAAEQRRIAEDSLSFLQSHIDDSMTFGEIADVFAELCAHPTANEEILFEAGTYTFTGKPMFTVSLARQIPDGEDEYYQIRAEFLFRPDADNAGITETMWLDPKDEDAFSAARRSVAFVYADTHTAVSFDLCIDET